jgi:hypothetical protein
VAAEHAGAAVAAAPPGVLHVDVENPVGEAPQEGDVVDALVAEVRRVVVEAEGGVAVDGLDGALGGGDVEGDLGRVHLEREAHAELGVGVEDRRPAAGEVVEARLSSLRGRREGVERVPDRRAGEAVDDLQAERGGGAPVAIISSAARWRTPSGSPSPQTCGGQDGLVALVDAVADRLADEVVGDGEELQVVLREQRLAFLDVGVRGGAAHVEVVAPAGELEAVVAHLARERGELGEREVGPLAGEEGDGSWHGASGEPFAWTRRAGSCGDGGGGGRPVAAPACRLEVLEGAVGEVVVGGVLGRDERAVEDVAAQRRHAARRSAAR